ncbi:MAG: FIG002473: Protein YcaR in KDO2-Lipid A biosynthesis cluster [uncultured Nocardioidaceae bacterium]|uniref:UPF0434 protein AVDCRST_MAG29-462 n=1 Tax=uncultured Nocardioidaceae bacterium TaxID=253824 RepID=A0A6J4L5K7_9ACTN|nr:MAG: FIG002473: Protein YcaR in KDO2-Lipid A biosynthesis cluster [uncultured Nocardioidaceae bacterium]
MNIDAGLLEILVCPACRAEVRVDEAAEEIVCRGCGLAYPVRDDIPVMLVDEARRPPPATRREPGQQSTARQAAAEGPGDVPDVDPAGSNTEQDSAATDAPATASTRPATDAPRA